MGGQDLRAFRVEFSLSQRALGEILGVPRTSLVAIEQGEMKMPLWMPLALGALKANAPPYVGPPEIVAEIKAKRHLRIVNRKHAFAL